MTENEMVPCKVPDNLEVILSYADSREFLNPLYDGIFLNEKKEKFWIDKITGANAFELYASGLSKHLTSEGDTNGVQVAETVKKHKLEVERKFPVHMLTPRTSYKVLFSLMKKKDTKGLDQPVKLKLLLPNQEPIECTQDLSSMLTNESKEVLVGDFITSYDHLYGNMEISMTQTDTEYMKKGLVVDKILIQPVMKDWKELSGENKWDGLLNPLNIDLSKFVTGYGERLQAIYDCMIKDEKSPEHQLPLHQKEDFFNEVGLDKGKGKALTCQTYEVKKYIYAWVNPSFIVEDKSTWIGYVAVTTEEGARLLGRRDILVCWRGTSHIEEWIQNLKMLPTHAEVIYPTIPKAVVHKGFYSIYTKPHKQHNNKSARDQVVDEVKELIHLYKDKEVSITITGHSLGAALATLNAADIVSNGYNKSDLNPENEEFWVTAFVFGSPKVGDLAFQTEFNKHVLTRKLRLLRIENCKDWITTVPPGIYVKVGNEITFPPTIARSDENGKIGPNHNLKNYIKELCALPYCSTSSLAGQKRKEDCSPDPSEGNKKQRTST